MKIAPSLVSALMLAGLWTLARAHQDTKSEAFGISRDWLPIVLTLVAYREMDWFTAQHPSHILENAWIIWDRALLHGYGLQSAIEHFGWPLPGYFEFCYLLVYGVAPFAVGALYANNRRDLVDGVLFTYLVGTLLAYGLFPYFPSDPPRTVFEGMDLPRVTTVLRKLNLAIVGGYGIHSSVFPSAHVSSAFSAAWGLLVLFRQRRAFGIGLLIYGASVAVATVYGRYHYAVDAIAGIVISLPGLVAAVAVRRSMTGRSASDGKLDV